MLQEIFRFLPAIFFVSSASICMAWPAPVPWTGLDSCFGESGGMTADCILKPGVEWPSPRFSNEQGNTVTDNLTGLMWMADGSVPAVSDCESGSMKWQEALDYITCLNTNNYLNHSDWRLPNISELVSLFKAGVADQATWLSSNGFRNITGGVTYHALYWSSTTNSGNVDKAWAMHMGSGELSYSEAKSSSWRLFIPVRGMTFGPAPIPRTGQSISRSPGDDGYYQAGVEIPAPRYTVNGDCVVDELTGRMWIREGHKLLPPVTWAEAMSQAAALSACSFDDWRLPTLSELRSLNNYSAYSPSIYLNSHGFQNVGFLYFYWSSTAATEGTAWTMSMDSGQQHKTPLNVGHLALYVRTQSIEPTPNPTSTPEPTLDLEVKLSKKVKATRKGVNYTLTARNNSSNASGAASVVIYLSRNKKLDNKDKLLKAWNVPNINSFQALNASFKYKGRLKAMNYYLIARISGTVSIEDDDPLDNTAILRFKVK